MRLSVQFFSLGGKFRREGKEQLFATEGEALAAVRVYAESAGYTQIKVADDASDDCVRFVGRTPGGRSGRNVAMGDWVADDDAWEDAYHESCALAAAAVVDAPIEAGARVRLQGSTQLGTVNEVQGQYAFVSWDGARTRRDPLSWLERVGSAKP